METKFKAGTYNQIATCNVETESHTLHQATGSLN